MLKSVCGFSIYLFMTILEKWEIASFWLRFPTILGSHVLFEKTSDSASSTSSS